MKTDESSEGVGAPFTADNGLLSHYRCCISVNVVNVVNAVTAANVASMVDNGASTFEHTASVRDSSEVGR